MYIYIYILSNEKFLYFVALFEWYKALTILDCYIIQIRKDF